MILKKIEINDNKNHLFGILEAPLHPKAIVIFSHGLLSGVKESQRFSFVKKFLHQNNFATLGTYFPGHGKRKNEEFTLKGCIETLERTIILAKEMYPTQPLSLFGISVGSSIIPCLEKDYFNYIFAIIFFSLITDLAVFKNFKFDWRHYSRWKTYGYSVSFAEKIVS